MPHPRKTDFERVRKVGLTVPGLEEGTAWDGPCLKADKKIAACMATHKSAEPGTLVVVVGEGVRDELIEGDPDVYYVKDHYVPWPTVLVRLAKIDDTVLHDLLVMAVRYRAAKTPTSHDGGERCATDAAHRGGGVEGSHASDRVRRAHAVARPVGTAPGSAAGARPESRALSRSGAGRRDSRNASAIIAA